MSVIQNNIDLVNATLTVKVSKEDYSEKYDKALKIARKKINVPGFRGQLQEAVITSNAGQPCQVRYGDQTLNFKTKKGQTYTITSVDGKLVKK